MVLPTAALPTPGSATLSEWLDRFALCHAAQQAAGTQAPLAGKLAINIERSLWSELLGEPLARYYQPQPDAAWQIQIQLRMQLYAHEHFTLAAAPLQRFVFPDFGLALLPSLFGAPICYRDGVEPAWENAVLLADGEEPPAAIPDFETAGLMPALLACHRQMRELLDASWQVGLPDWCRGPLGTVAYFRGQENAFLDLMVDPQRAHAMMEYGQRARFAWLRARAHWLGESTPGPAVLFNDDVSAENLSVRTYREQVWPFEKQCYDFHDGRLGYHSCGNITPFLEDIHRLGPLDFLHVSAWTDLQEAVRVFHPQTHLLVTLHPVRDVLGASPEHLRQRLRTIREACAGGPFTVMMTELMSYHTPQEDRAAIQRALEIAAEILC